MTFTRNLLITATMASVASFASPAFAGTSLTSGTVLSVDHSARTMKIRDDASARETTVFVPEGANIALSRIGNVNNEARVIPLERVHRGTRVKMRTQPSSATALLQTR